MDQATDSSRLIVECVSISTDPNEVTDRSAYKIDGTSLIYLPLQNFPSFLTAVPVVATNPPRTVDTSIPSSRNTVSSYLLAQQRDGRVSDIFEDPVPISFKQFHWNFRWTAQKTNPFWDNEARILTSLRTFEGAVEFKGKHDIQGAVPDDQKFVLTTVLECYCDRGKLLQPTCGTATEQPKALLRAPTLREIFHYLNFHPEGARLHAEIIRDLCIILGKAAKAVFCLHNDHEIAHLGLSMDEILVSQAPSGGSFLLSQSDSLTENAVKLVDFEMARKFDDGPACTIRLKENVPVQSSVDIQKLLFSCLRMETVRERELLLPPEMWSLSFAALPSNYPRDLYCPRRPYNKYKGSYLPAYKDLWDLGQIYFHVFLGVSFEEFTRSVFKTIQASDKHYSSPPIPSISLGDQEAVLRVIPFATPDVDEALTGERNFLALIYYRAPYLNNPRYDAITYRMVKFLHPHAPLRVQGWDIPDYILQCKPPIARRPNLFPPTLTSDLRNLGVDGRKEYIAALIAYIDRYKDLYTEDDDIETEDLMKLLTVDDNAQNRDPVPEDKPDLIVSMANYFGVFTSDEDMRYEIMEGIVSQPERDEDLDIPTPLVKSDPVLQTFFHSEDESMDDEDDLEQECLDDTKFDPNIDF